MLFKDINVDFIDVLCWNLASGYCEKTNVKLKEVIRGAHSLVEAKEKKRITQKEMAGRIKVGYRTYMEYQRGTNAPLSMRALLNLLAMLDDQEIVRVVREWEKTASNESNVEQQ